MTDENGKIKSVILDYKLYQKIEEIFLDIDLAKVENKEETSFLITEEQKSELDRRLAAYQTDKNKGRPASEAIAEIRKRL
ncbi:MAG: addiction module protein [Deltaproteobacteria bacterium]|nr:addiction module protein [Deltaproteobacteria bacterium]